MSVIALLFSLALPARADSSVWNAVQAEHIKWTNTSTNWVDGDLVITYKTDACTLHLPGFAKVWALAVGGGGAGGAR